MPSEIRPDALGRAVAPIHDVAARSLITIRETLPPARLEHDAVVLAWERVKDGAVRAILLENG